MKKVLSTKRGRKAMRGPVARKAVTSTASTQPKIIVTEKPQLIVQEVADDLFENVIRPSGNVGLLCDGFDAKALSKLLIDVDDRFTVATCEAAEYQFAHCVGELALEALEAQGMAFNGHGKITLVHTLKSDYAANKHTLKRGAIMTQSLNAGQARKHAGAKSAERFTAKV